MPPPTGMAVEWTPTELSDRPHIFELPRSEAAKHIGQPARVVSPVAGLCMRNSEFKGYVKITAELLDPGANGWNCVFIFVRTDGSREERAPHRVGDCKASVLIDDVSDVTMCWVETKVPGVHSFFGAALFAASVAAIALSAR